MKIYLVRHGDSTPLIPDDQRPLSKQGKEEIHCLAQWLKPLHIEVAKTFHSKRLRTQQTAEILLSAITSRKPAIMHADLDPLASLTPMLDEIRYAEEDLLLVGHLPFMSHLLSRLTTGDMYHEVVNFQTSTMVCLERLSEEHWIIDWAVNSKILMTNRYD